jgi:hypothetical protein
MSLRWCGRFDPWGSEEGNAPPAARLNLVSTWGQGASFTASAAKVRFWHLATYRDVSYMTAFEGKADISQRRRTTALYEYTP